MEKNVGFKLAIGTVQFGLNYGISNTSGKVGELKVDEILNEATKNNIDTLDTAIVYGESEDVLGRIGVNEFKIVTKLPPAPKNVTNVKTWAVTNVNLSLKKLNVKKVYGLILHQSDDFLGEQGFELYDTLCELRESGLVDKIGVSIYSPDELDSLEDSGVEIDIVQAPFNILDRRLETSGWMRKLKSSGVEIHVRSVFLQGLLLLGSNNRSQYFSKWNNYFKKFDRWIVETNQSPLGACLNFVNSFKEIDKIVVGVETVNQLREIISSLDGNYRISVPAYLEIDDTMLINPSNWEY